MSRVNFLDMIRERMQRPQVPKPANPPKERVALRLWGRPHTIPSEPLTPSAAPVESIPSLPDYMISPKNRQTLTEMFESQGGQELEFSLGSFVNDKFLPGLKSYIPIMRLINHYTNEHGEPEVTNDTVIISGADEKNKRLFNIRKIITQEGGVQYERKIRHGQFRDTTWGYRVSLSSEEGGVDVNDKAFNKVAAVSRLRRRMSFEFDNVRLDVTIVVQSQMENGHVMKDRSFTKYEIELERIGDISVDGFMEHVRNIYNVIGGGEAISWEQRNVIMERHNRLVGRGVQTRQDEMVARYWNKPENIDIDKDILNDVKFDPAVTLKLDGERRMLLVLSNVTCLVWAPGEIMIVGPGDVSLNDTLLDVEYMENDESLYAFDILFLRGEDVRRKPLRVRINFLLTLLDKTSGLFARSAFYGNIKGASAYEPVSGEIRPFAQEIPLPPIGKLPGTVRLSTLKTKKAPRSEPVQITKRVSGKLSSNTTSRFIFHSLSEDVAPGLGTNERLDPSMQPFVLVKSEGLPDYVYDVRDLGPHWRRMLDNSYECKFLYNGREFKTAEHALQYVKFREMEYDDEAIQFTLPSAENMSVDEARVIGGKYEKQLAELLKKMPAEPTPAEKEPTVAEKLKELEKAEKGEGKAAPKKGKKEAPKPAVNNNWNMAEQLKKNLAKWDMVKEFRLQHVVHAKFQQCLDAQKVLLRTGDARLYLMLSPGEYDRWLFLEKIRDDMMEALVENENRKKEATKKKVPSKRSTPGGGVASLKDLTFNVKKFLFPTQTGDGQLTDFYQRAEECLLTAPPVGKDGKELPTDGIILQGLGEYNDKARKWKPHAKLTIDFRIVDGGIFVGTKQGDKPFTGTKSYPLPEDFVVSGSFDNGGIYEMKWTGETFELERERPDKVEPNFITTAMSVWEDINRPVTPADITGHGLSVMRKYINRAKEDILRQELPSGSTIVDWGTGRGGMFGIWNRVGVAKAYAVEPDEDNREEMKRRKKAMKLNTKLIPVPTGAEDTDVIVSAIKSKDNIDAITTFFSLTFFPESESKFDKMLQTIGTIRPTKVIGMVLDGDRVKDGLLKSLIGQAEDDAGEIKTEAFTISQVTPMEGTFGNEIETTIHDETSMVKAVTEWLLFFPYLVDKMNEMGYKLTVDRFLEEKHSLKNPTVFYRLSEEARQFSSYNRVFSFTRRDKASKVRIGRMYVLQEGDVQPLPNRLSEHLIYKGVGSAGSFVQAVLAGKTAPKKLVEKKDVDEAYVKDVSKILQRNIIILMADEQRIDKQQRIVDVNVSVMSVTDVDGDVSVVYTPDDVHFHTVLYRPPANEGITALKKEAQKKKVVKYTTMDLKQLRAALKLPELLYEDETTVFQMSDPLIQKMLSIKAPASSYSDKRSDSDDDEEERSDSDDGDERSDGDDEEVTATELTEQEFVVYEKIWDKFKDESSATDKDVVKQIDKTVKGKELDIGQKLRVAKAIIYQIALLRQDEDADEDEGDDEAEGDDDADEGDEDDDAETFTKAVEDIIKGQPEAIQKKLRAYAVSLEKSGIVDDDKIDDFSVEWLMENIDTIPDSADKVLEITTEYKQWFVEGDSDEGDDGDDEEDEDADADDEEDDEGDEDDYDEMLWNEYKDAGRIVDDDVMKRLSQTGLSKEEKKGMIARLKDRWSTEVLRGATTTKTNWSDE